MSASIFQGDQDEVVRCPVCGAIDFACRPVPRKGGIMMIATSDLGTQNTSFYELDRKLWLTTDESHVVEDGDPDAKFLLGVKGVRIPRPQAVRLGLVGETKAAPDATHHEVLDLINQTNQEPEPEPVVTEPEPKQAGKEGHAERDHEKPDSQKSRRTRDKAVEGPKE